MKFRSTLMIERRLNSVFYPKIFLDPENSDQIDQARKTSVFSELNFYLAGDVCKKFLRLKQLRLPHKKQVWVLSEFAREKLIAKFSIEAQSVRVVDPNSIFPTAEFQKSIDPKKVINFVFAGRIMPEKGIELACELIQILNEEYSQRCQLLIYGELQFEDTSAAWRLTKESKGKFERLVANIRAKKIPNVRILGVKSKFDWCKELPENSVFISLSRFPFEDFGVAVFQAKAQGIPCVLSDWGGHRIHKSGSDLLLKQFNNYKLYKATKVSKDSAAKSIFEFINSRQFVSAKKRVTRKFDLGHKKVKVNNNFCSWIWLSNSSILIKLNRSDSFHDRESNLLQVDGLLAQVVSLLDGKLRLKNVIQLGKLSSKCLQSRKFLQGFARLMDLGVLIEVED